MKRSTRKYLAFLSLASLIMTTLPFAYCATRPRAYTSPDPQEGRLTREEEQRLGDIRELEKRVEKLYEKTQKALEESENAHEEINPDTKNINSQDK